jgi:hypothetical protein
VIGYPAALMDWNELPWARWNVTYTERGGTPVLTETGLWYLMAHHPDTVEDAGDGSYWVELDRSYRATPVPGRAFFACVPAAPRRRK